MIKILYYNWVQFDDDENRGGGVTVYQRNLIKNLLQFYDKKQEHVDVFFISSGIFYSPINETPYLKRTKNSFGSRCKSFAIVNSPILSPGHLSFNDIEIYLNDETLRDIFKNFIEKYGPFDVIHFNNFEGLSLKVLEIKKFFPNTKIIFSMHNYYSFCPQVNLWKNECVNCIDFHSGRDCTTCLPNEPDKNIVLFANKLAYFLKKNHFNSNSVVFKLAFSRFDTIRRICKYICKKIRKQKENNVLTLQPSRLYKDFRNKNIEYLNKYVDKFLCVSDRVRQITLSFGLLPEKTFTDYIGTDVAKNQMNKCVANPKSDIFSMIYMGYMRHDKGFYFLLRVLRKIPPEYAKKIRIVFATKIMDKKIFKHLSKYFYEVIIYDGYSHSDLPEILKNINLGLVPVLWEDNLPQVAIEMVANGLPIFVSDLGGSQELCNNDLFVFKSGDVVDFVKKLIYLIRNRDELDKFWQKNRHLTTFSEHICNLMKYYDLD